MPSPATTWLHVSGYRFLLRRIECARCSGMSAQRPVARAHNIAGPRVRVGDVAAMGCAFASCCGHSRRSVRRHRDGSGIRGHLRAGVDMFASGVEPALARLIAADERQPATGVRSPNWATPKRSTAHQVRRRSCLTS